MAFFINRLKTPARVSMLGGSGVRGTARDIICTHWVILRRKAVTFKVFELLSPC